MNNTLKSRIVLNSRRLLRAINLPQVLARVLFKRSGFRVYRGSMRGLRQLSPYQPLFGIGSKNRHQDLIRDVEVRAEAISRHSTGGSLLLDLGCMNGFMTFSNADKYDLVLGLDSSLSSVQVARMLQIRNGSLNSAFAVWDLSPSTISDLPVADTVLLLSVFHHWVVRFGHDQAVEMLSVVSQKAKRQIFFETGQPEEVLNKWSSDLKFMEPDPERWIHEVLRKVGFTSTETISKTPGYLHGPVRYLVLAEK